jgi:chromosome segregation ATPase
MAAERRSGGLVEFQPMSPEEIERTMQFVLRQQAEFAADFGKVSVQIDALSAKTDRIADGLIGLTGIVGRLATAQETTDQQIRELDRQAAETKLRMSELGDYIKTVESHLNVVIEMFERHLREDHGPRPS